MSTPTTIPPIGQRFCKDCLHYENDGSLYGGNCLRNTQHFNDPISGEPRRSNVAYARWERNPVEPLTKLENKYCGKEGRHWTVKPVPVKKKRPFTEWLAQSIIGKP